MHQRLVTQHRPRMQMSYDVGPRAAVILGGKRVCGLPSYRGRNTLDTHMRISSCRGCTRQQVCFSTRPSDTPAPYHANQPAPRAEGLANCAHPKQCERECHSAPAGHTRVAGLARSPRRETPLNHKRTG